MSSTYYQYGNGVVIRSPFGVPNTGWFGPAPVGSTTQAERDRARKTKLLIYGGVALAAYFLFKEVL